MDESCNVINEVSIYEFETSLLLLSLANNKIHAFQIGYFSLSKLLKILKYESDTTFSSLFAVKISNFIQNKGSFEEKPTKITLQINTAISQNGQNTHIHMPYSSSVLRRQNRKTAVSRKSSSREKRKISRSPVTTKEFFCSEITLKK